jgi:hypothetical protein
MPNWNTIHVFGFGQSQMIGPDKNGGVANDELSSVSPLIDYLASIQQEGTSINPDTFHVFNIYQGQFIDFVANTRTGNKSQRFNMADIDTTTVDNLADEIYNSIG